MLLWKEMTNSFSEEVASDHRRKGGKEARCLDKREERGRKRD